MHKNATKAQMRARARAGNGIRKKFEKKGSFWMSILAGHWCDQKSYSRQGYGGTIFRFFFTEAIPKNNHGGDRGFRLTNHRNAIEEYQKSESEKTTFFETRFYPVIGATKKASHDKDIDGQFFVF